MFINDLLMDWLIPLPQVFYLTTHLAIAVVQFTFCGNEIYNSLYNEYVKLMIDKLSSVFFLYIYIYKGVWKKTTPLI